MEAFHRDYLDTLPEPAVSALKAFLSNHESTFRQKMQGQSWALLFAAAALSSLQTELDYYFSDTESFVRAMTIRALLHLKRSLVVDPQLAIRWKDAFDKREEHVEKLGAVHLLQHGIWAFKVDSKGEKTDLVLQEPLRVTEEVRSAAIGLVLTEWKLVKGEEVKSKAEEAFRQVKLYEAGSLAGFELTSTRYLVSVHQENSTQDRFG